MALPKVNVNVQEQTLLTANTEIPFVPAVLLKTKSGPIGTIETLTSESQFKALFGESDETVPSAYAIQTYLRSYSYVLVTRLANENEAKLGTGTVTFGDEIKLIKIESKYKTDLFNGKEVKLKYDGTNHKLWLDVSSITGKNTISIKEDYIADTATAVDLTAVLDKLISSINVSNLGITLTNEYSDSTTPTVEQLNNGISAFIEGGDSGNNTPLDDTKVKTMIDLYDLPDRNIDVMIIPEYNSYNVTNYATQLALKNNFLVLATAQGKDYTEAIASVDNYVPDTKGSLAIYFPNVYYNNFTYKLDDSKKGQYVPVPASIAVLHAYAKTDIQTKWGAPAGVTRGNLTLVSGLETQLSEGMLDALYSNNIPINGIYNISGKGFIVWGNKTASADSNFFDRINVARLVKYITRKAYDISWNYIFEPITNAVFISWQSKIEAMLASIKTGYGLEDYRVIMDDSINTPQTIAANQLNGIIRIKPQEVAEYINIDFTVTDTIEVTVEE